MPLYEYYCKKCQTTFEVMQQMSEGGKAKCPQCKKAAQKQVSAAGFQLKGTGWYKTDYASKPVEPKSESKSEAKTESKSESQSPTKKEEKKTS